MNSTCFVSPALPLAQRALAPVSRSVSPTRVVPTASLRFPGGNFNPFSGSSSSGRGFSFWNFGGSGSSGSHFGSGGRGGRGKTPGDSSSGSADSNNPFSQLWAAYNARLEQNPIATKAFTSLIGFLLGDLIAQKFLGDKNADIDLQRLARMASFGLLIHGPTGHYFYSALDNLIVGTSVLKVAAKVAIDQIFWAPIFTAAFFAYLGITERKSKDDIIKKVKNDTWSGVTASWKFWPLAHAVNFSVIPTSQRLLYINFLQVGYNVILSLLGNK